MRIVSIVITMGLIISIGCNTQSPGRLEIHDGPVSDAVRHVLCRLDSAQKDIKYFDSLCRIHLGDTIPPISAYTIRAIDLLDALGLTAMKDSSKYKYIRMYLGFRKENGFKCFIVPVDSADLSGTHPENWRGGYDILLDSTGKRIPRKLNQVHNSKSEFVLDLNAPCPNTCATNSPLEK